MKALGLNYRNRIIKEFNSPCNIQNVKDKLACKVLLQENGIGTPKTLFIIRHISDIRSVEHFPPYFVIKPNSGYGGHGVMILKRNGEDFVTAGHRSINFHDIKLHIEKILDGQYSEYSENDTAIIEERLFPAQWMRFSDPTGVPDIRIICVKAHPVMAMMRYPTVESQGKANICAGALGISLDIRTGELLDVYSKVAHAHLGLAHLEISPKSCIPGWNQILLTAARAAVITGLDICGIDLVVNHENHIQVLEANAYPGLEIQNVNRQSMRLFV